MIKTTIVSFAGSRHRDGTPMFPGKYRCHWVLVAGSVWVLAAMEPFDAA